MQFVLAVRGHRGGAEGPAVVGSHHRHHHRYSDTEQDLHSPLKGFWWSHVGWILCDKNNGWDEDDIRTSPSTPSCAC